MNTSIAMVCNVYQDAAALRGLLETSAPFFDNLFIIHAGPGGARSTDGTIELCEQFGVQPVFDDIARGFGMIRSRLVHECGCDWAMILDADERFHPRVPRLDCSGSAQWDFAKGLDCRPDLVVAAGATIDQGRWLRDAIANTSGAAVRTTRRHWFDFSMRHPSQNWSEIPDHQLRVVRNLPEIAYDSSVKMHEQLKDSRTERTPVYIEGDSQCGPFHDHYHLFFRKTQPGHKEHNERNYSRLQRGEPLEPQA